MQLVRPAPEHLPSYTDALTLNWSPCNVRGLDATRDELLAIRTDPAAFLDSLDDPEGKGPAITLPDGSTAPRIPGYTRWIWDDDKDEFCGTINLRWLPDTTELPPHVSGHIGYAVVPWQRRRGCATYALRSILIEAAALGMPRVHITTDLHNLTSQHVISRCGGVPREAFVKPACLGGAESMRFRVYTSL